MTRQALKEYGLFAAGLGTGAAILGPVWPAFIAAVIIIVLIGLEGTSVIPVTL